MFDIISIGDCVVDAFMFINDFEIRCDVDKENCKLCVNYADKVPVEKFKLCSAGNANNNAVGSARLGLKTAIYTEIGEDNNGKMIVDSLRKEGISLDFVNLNKGANTNLHSVISYQGERTIFVYHEKRDYKLPKFEEAPKWIYYTSLAEGFEPFQEELVGYLAANPSVKLGFNPATFHLKAGLEVLRNIIKLTEVIFVNKEEAKRLLGIDEKKHMSFEDLHKEIAKLGVKISVITDGPKGSTVYDSKAFYQLGLYDVPIVERTGVGDSFATAFIAALFYGKGIEEALKWGTVESSGVIQKIGPQEGLMTKAELDAILAKNPTYTEVSLLA